MLANKLDHYKRKGNRYIDDNIQEIQELYVDKEMKKEREDWSRLYHKTLKGIKAMINVQRIVKDIKKMVEEMNTMITEMEGTILMVSINNWTVNTTKIMQISKDL